MIQATTHVEAFIDFFETAVQIRTAPLFQKVTNEKSTLNIVDSFLGCASTGRTGGTVVATLDVTNRTGGFVDVWLDNTKLTTVLRIRKCVKIYEHDFAPTGFHSFTFRATAERPFSTQPVSLSNSWAIQLSPWPSNSSRFLDASNIAPAPRCDLE